MASRGWEYYLGKNPPNMCNLGIAVWQSVRAEKRRQRTLPSNRACRVSWDLGPHSAPQPPSAGVGRQQSVVRRMAMRTRRTCQEAGNTAAEYGASHFHQLAVAQNNIGVACVRKGRFVAANNAFRYSIDCLKSGTSSNDFDTCKQPGASARRQEDQTAFLRAKEVLGIQENVLALFDEIDASDSQGCDAFTATESGFLLFCRPVRLDGAIQHERSDQESSAVIMFNLALINHLQGTQEGDDSALDLYGMALRMMAWERKCCPNKKAYARALALVMATFNNMALIHMCRGQHEPAMVNFQLLCDLLEDASEEEEEHADILPGISYNLSLLMLQSVQYEND